MANTQGANPANSPGAESRAGMQTVKVNENRRPLFDAALKGDWKAVKKILDDDREAMTTAVMIMEGEALNVLHVAVMVAPDQLVENLVKRIPPERKNEMAGEALIWAAWRGRLRMVKVLTDQIDSKDEWITSALRPAIAFAPMQKEVIWYLARRTTSDVDITEMKALIKTGNIGRISHSTHLITCLLELTLFCSYVPKDVALYFALRQPGLATSKIREDMLSPLAFLATMEPHFLSTARFNFWEKLIYKCIPLCWVDTSFDSSNDTKMARALKQLKASLWNLATTAVPFIKRIGELKFRHKYSLEFANLALVQMKTHMETPEILEFLLTNGVVKFAIIFGISEIVKLCLKHYPELMWENDMMRSMIIPVLKRRHVELFRLLNPYQTIAMLDSGLNADSLMEAIVESPPGCVPADVSGAAFFMQRELQWYKVVEDSVGPFLTDMRWVKGRHWDHFIEQRQDLLKEAGQWMKDTASSCSLVATLIITVAFAAVFTIPGGNDNNTGMPIFLKRPSFMVFTAANALALFSSITATLMFLAILTSRYAAEDFLHSLPRKMILGLTFLFLSLVFMLVAFGSALTIVLSEKLKWIHIPITLLAAFPIVLFTILQLPLFVEMVESTCWPRLYRPLKIWK
ncbi:uncharacterized protein LOC104438189 isoform X2 [Eucalyptus grandis]|uniref:uncharacterized protein LOC104438189 isoform X2 n=1 Tax=Eucalyptus grandis TaxID=71139 RepID=UPI00192EE601|nr:uncharacterized protein LOC104438189 isoform X2 [Eucalyptus grandis]